jgi:putative sigma-54 modulation protein
MKLTVTARQVALTDAVRAQIHRRLDRLDRLLNGHIVSAQCVVGRERAAFVCELTVHARGDHMLHGLGSDGRLPTAVARAVEKVVQQGQRLADRWKTRRRGSRPRAGAAAEPETAAAERPRLIRTRGYEVKPMSLDDAVLTLETAGHPFLVFRHAASEQMAILYRRPDGHYGLIEPEA